MNINHILLEVFSWRLVSELHRRYPDRLQIIQTHPCSGQYNCLTVFDSRRPKFHADFNRPGSMHVWGENDSQSYDIWPEILEHGNQKSLLDVVCRRLQLPEIKKVPVTSRLTLVYRFIATFLTHTTCGIHRWTCCNGYVDTSGYGGGISKVFAKFPEAEERLRIKTDLDLFDHPAYRFWFVYRGDVPLICIDSAGFLWLEGDLRMYDMMKEYNKNKRNIWATVTSITAHLMN